MKNAIDKKIHNNKNNFDQYFKLSKRTVYLNFIIPLLILLDSRSILFAFLSFMFTFFVFVGIFAAWYLQNMTWNLLSEDENYKEDVVAILKK